MVGYKRTKLYRRPYRYKYQIKSNANQHVNTFGWIIADP